VPASRMWRPLELASTGFAITALITAAPPAQDPGPGLEQAPQKELPSRTWAVPVAAMPKIASSTRQVEESAQAALRSYCATSHELSPRQPEVPPESVRSSFIVTDSEAEALRLESKLDQAPPAALQRAAQDDKKYPYLCITWSEPYPAHLHNPGGGGSQAPWTRFYGPYVGCGPVGGRTLFSGQTGVFRLRQRPPAPLTASAPA